MLRCASMQAGVDVSKHGGHAYPGMEGIYKAIESRDLEAYMTTPAVLDPENGDLGGKGMALSAPDMRDDLHGRVRSRGLLSALAQEAGLIIPALECRCCMPEGGCL